MTNDITLRDALQLADLPKIYKYIHKKDSNNIAKCDRPTLKQVTSSYSKVIAELLALPPTTPYKYSWYVDWQDDWYEKHCKENGIKYDGDGKYIDVRFVNHEYVAPEPNLKPWGGDGKKKVPVGHYDCNADIHNEFFGCGLTDWNEIIDTPIIDKTDFPLEHMLGELLWELTFYGWSNEKVKENREMLSDRLEIAIKDIESGDIGEVVDIKSLLNTKKSSKKK